MNHYQNTNQYPGYALPKLILDTAFEVQAQTQAPFEMIATALLATCSLASQNSIMVRRPNGMQSCCSAFYLILAESGERKSAVEKIIMQPIFQHEVQQRQIYEKSRAGYDIAIGVWNADRKAILAAMEAKTKKGYDTEEHKLKLAEILQNKPKEPKSVKHIYNDVTPEALLYGLYEKSNSAGIISDEAGTIFDTNTFRNLGMLNKLWEAAPITVDRKTSHSFTIENPRLTMCLMVQPMIFQQYLERHGDTARNYGFFARFLMAAPISTQGTRFIYTEKLTEPLFLPKFHARIGEVLARNLLDIENENFEPTIFEFSSDAKRRWIEAYNQIESLLAAGGPLAEIKDFASKAAENIARLAAVFHFIEYGEGDISYDLVDRSCTIIAWHIEEARRLFGNAPKIAQEEADSRLLLTWMVRHARDNGTSMVMKTHARKNCPYALRKDKRFDLALDFLMKLDQTRLVVAPGKGKATVAYCQINPSCFNYQ